MTVHVRDFTVEFEAEEENVPVVTAGLVEWMERRLAEEAALGRIDGYAVSVSRDVAREEVRT